MNTRAHLATLRSPFRLLLAALGLLLALFLPATRLHAQAAATGALTGSVLDAAQGKFLEGADVAVVGTAIKTVTERGGRFLLTGVPAGACQLEISYLGLETQTVAATAVAGQTVEVAPVRLTGEVVMLDAMVVTGSREGMSQAMALQKVAVQSKVVAAADQFGPVSEGNVGEYLKFLPGVSIDYNVNDARGVSLRGLSTAFTIVSVDGTPMAGASSIDLTRRFEFEQIAMNNVETTELFKTVTPDIPAGATGGFVNFVTKSAFDHNDRQRISYDLSFGGPSSNFKFQKTGGVWGHNKEFPVRPSLELNVSRKITDKVGINLNYRYSDKYDDAPRNIENWTISGTTPTLGSYTVQDEQKLTHRESFAAKVDFKLSDRTQVFVAGSWNNYDLVFTQRGLVFNLGSNSVLTGNSVTSGTAGTRTVTNSILQRRKYGDTYHLNATLQHRFGDDSVLTFTPYYSVAEGYYDDTKYGYISGTSTFTYSASSSPFSTIALGGIYDLSQAPVVVLSKGSTLTPVDYLRDLGNYTLSNAKSTSGWGTGLQSRPWSARDIKDGFNGSYSRELVGGPNPVKIELGYSYDETYRGIYKPDFRPESAAVTGTALRALADPDYTKDVAFGFGPAQAIDPYRLWAASSGATMNLNGFEKYRFDETNTAGYVRLDAHASPELLVVTGVRWEERSIDAFTDRFSIRRASASGPQLNLFASGVTKLKYANWFPSATFKYTPRKSLVLRGGMSRTVGHPDYTDLVTSVTPESTPSANDGGITIADPDLKPYFAHNFDLGVDWYLGRTGVVGLTAFRKKLNNFISNRAMTAAELAAAADSLGVNAGDYSAGSITLNGASATYQGFEFSYAQTLGFLPRPFNGINIQANYTLTDIGSSDLDTEYSAKRAVSPQAFNLILGYRHGRFNTTITNNWTDENLYGGFVNTSYFAGTGDNRLLRMKDERWQTDVKLEYSLSKYASLYVTVRNILNTGRDEFFQGYTKEKRHIRLPMRYGEFGEPYYTFGVRATF